MSDHSIFTNTKQIQLPELSPNIGLVVSPNRGSNMRLQHRTMAAESVKILPITADYLSDVVQIYFTP